ncbi:hypothetical protein DNH61_06495 [Paenibacillus sambharensis]|uniref:ABC transporter ATP-binding protein n=1 Tax=Paenibacillus sambharensis TaxID=1803190 RepID=A0A2W1LPJ1_9BACL|nr:ABC transporter ATP-binding protein [Paenibacillus sambharensis]PZD96842.1 hypothetical protein DNH61_06495 [Paenibacillus sambharensis]
MNWTDRFAVIRRLWTYLRDYKGRLFLISMLIVAGIGAELSGPYLLKIILDNHLAVLGTDEEHLFDPDTFWMLVGLYAASFVTASGMNVWRSYISNTTAIKFMERLRMELLTRSQRIGMRYFDRQPAGAIVSRVFDDTESVKNVLLHTAGSFIIDSLRVLFLYVAIFLLSPRIALLSLLILPMFFAFHYITVRYNGKYLKVIKELKALKNTIFSEAVQVMPVLQLFRAEKAAAARYNEANDKLFKNSEKRLYMLHMTDINLNGLINGLLVASLVWVVGSQSLHTAVTFGLLYTVIQYINQICQTIGQIGIRLTHTNDSFVSAERMFALMDEADENWELNQTEEETIARIAFKNVSFGYQPGQQVLKNISFEARRGQTVAIVGLTGSGKSTILNLLQGLYSPNEGSIYVNDREIHTVDTAWRRNRTAVVMQDSFLLKGSIADNVAFLDKNMARSQIHEALSAVGMSQFAGQKDVKGSQHALGESGGALSFGQKQLVAFARALAHNPEVLLLDEATSKVDSETEAQIMETLRKRCEERIQLVVAHRLSTVKEADLILVLHRGEIAEQGTHEQLLQMRGRYHRLYMLQQMGSEVEAG